MCHGAWIHKLAVMNAPALPTLTHQGDADTPNEWHVGPTGCGKSRSVRDRYPDLYSKDASNAWFESYNGEEVVLVDDVDKYHVKQGYHLKIWADRYPFRGNVKGSSVMMRPEKIIVTSNYFPEDIWNDKTTLEPIYRRFQMHRWSADGTCAVSKPGDEDHHPNEQSAFVFPLPRNHS